MRVWCCCMLTDCLVMTTGHSSLKSRLDAMYEAHQVRLFLEAKRQSYCEGRPYHAHDGALVVPSVCAAPMALSLSARPALRPPALSVDDTAVAMQSVSEVDWVGMCRAARANRFPYMVQLLMATSAPSAMIRESLQCAREQLQLAQLAMAQTQQVHNGCDGAARCVAEISNQRCVVRQVAQEDAARELAAARAAECERDRAASVPLAAFWNDVAALHAVHASFCLRVAHWAK